MHKFNSDKKPTGRAIDGILSSGPRKPKIDPIMRGSQPRLDDFKRADGFHGQSTPQLSSAGAMQKTPATSTSVRPRPSIPQMKGRGSSVFPQGNMRKSNKKRNMWKIFGRSSLIVLVIVLSITGFLFGKAWWNTNKVFKGGAEGALALNKDLDPSLLKGEGDGRVNILLLGKGGEGHEGGNLTDSIMIASIDPINKETALLSIPRDLWVKPSGLWPMKINAVYASAMDQAYVKKPNDDAGAEKAGVAAIEKVIEDYMGVPVHYYTTIDFKAFEQAVNAVGGIDVNLPTAYSDPTMLVGRKYFSLPAGQQKLDGGYALAYARSRYGEASGDFGRAEHQRIVIVAIKDKVLSLGTFANPLKVTQLLDTFGDRVTTNLSIGEIMRVYDITKQIDSSKITSTSLANKDNPLVVTSNIGGQSVVVPKAGVNNYDEIRSFVRNQLKDGYIKNENASVIILNASGKSGVAQARADELKGYGYNVIQVADAGTPGITGTQLIDQTKGVKKYTKRYLEQRLGTSALSNLKNLDLTPYNADFIIVIGQ